MIEWFPSDREQFQAYLAKSEYKIFKVLKHYIPKIDAETLEKVALQSSEKQGAENLLEKLELLAEKQIERREVQQHVDPTVGLPK